MAALWGLLGAFVYAAPAFLACLYTDVQIGRSRARCWLELAVACATGTIAAAAFTPWAAEILRADQGNKLPAISASLGLVANRLAPGLIDVLTGRILRSIRNGAPTPQTPPGPADEPRPLGRSDLPLDGGLPVRAARDDSAH